MPKVLDYSTLPITQEHPYVDVPGSSVECRYLELVDHWTDHLKFKSWQLTKNKEVSEDIVQDAFLCLWQQREKVIPENPVGWLLTVVRNLSIRYNRDKNIELRTHSQISQTHKSFYTEVEEKLLNKEQQLQLSVMINRLPKQQKMVLCLNNEVGLKRSEIAQFLKLSPNTVKVHLARATQFLKDYAVCFGVYILLFVCHNFFFKDSNTIDRDVEWYKKKIEEAKHVSQRTTTQESPALLYVSQLSALPLVKSF